MPPQRLVDRDSTGERSQVSSVANIALAKPEELLQYATMQQCRQVDWLEGLQPAHEGATGAGRMEPRVGVFNVLVWNYCYNYYYRSANS